jgi:anti-anti-sigma factor
MATLERRPTLIDEPEAPSRASLRSGVVRRLGARTTVRLTVDGPAPAAVFVAGEIDLACADELAVVLCATLDAYPQGMDLDLAAVRFCDCRGLRALLTAQAFARRRGRHFALGRHSPAVARLLDLSDTRSAFTAASH